jgi:Lon protease-like protein
VRADGLIVADVRWLPETDAARMREEHALLGVLLARILDKAGVEHDGVGKGRLAEADFVGWRLAEWLPLSPQERQWLLQLDDPHERLQQLVERLPDFQPD